MRIVVTDCVRCGVVVWFALVGLVRGQESDDTTRPKLSPEVEEIISGWRANRQRFPFARVKMVWTKGYARSIEDARNHIWLPEPKPVRSERLWITDGMECDVYETLTLTQSVPHETIAVRPRA